ncbi:hypothetical protein [Ligilactobacillus salivarius]|uniref:hypothetical protein n=1 Tax=Ligilactobacillus salivarius TaxID=1624 RepID=UPI0009DA4C64|nr:hypothetical protein [Ligilactobacillus salivarius]OQR00527.1 hypothetical protein B6U48_08445 [Ligilactobacillus salivarius]
MDKDYNIVKGFSGYWLIDEKSKVYSQQNDKYVYKANAVEYPDENKLPYIIVDEDYNFIYDDVKKIND